ncbi:sterol-sensing domain of SREBP cleavage-activation-domain-containing protein [Flammula alnicola]|nr:sterol-sensing domain of SREBP cleavage-activation-domain-containing protein [Flammula alnicola]
MSVYTSGPLQWARTLGQRFFLQFGLHCATHQIRVILISCVVITSLFYPALDLYTSSRDSSQSILDAIISPNSRSLENDLVNLWSAQDTIRVHEDPVTRAKCRGDHALRVERIFIQSPFVEDDGALNLQILLSTLNLECRLQDLVLDPPCLKKVNGQCLVISPLAFWNYDKDALISDPNILDTLSDPKNISEIPVTPHMVLAGRGSYEHPVGGNKFDYANFLALTYFFPNSPCWDSGTEHTQWVRTVKRAIAQNGEVTAQVPEATLIALEYDPHRSEFTSEGWSAISAFLYLAYIGFFVYVAWSVRRMDAVHSRLGVTFTALVEIAVSTITSLSVCALVGFKITMVPWELLPIVIVFVGAENMFNLVDAVGKTSVTLSVKQRIAEGLSRAGTSNTLKVVSYNAILGVIAVFAVGAVRQFCIFAIVVLVAHWFLAHTFFMAVLSIDIARLELEELLHHDTFLPPSVPPFRKESQNTKEQRPKWQRLMVTIQNLLRGRAATNISLLMLLAIAATLYYTTYTASTSTLSPSLPKSLGAVSRMKARPSSDAASTPEHIWKTLNPTQAPLLHLRIESPTIITFSPNGGGTSSSSTMQPSYRSRYTIRTFKFVLWLLTILVLPIAATTSALWGLLLYLLKNTELLEAQRHRSEAESASHAQEGQRSLQDQISFSTLPRALASDVELIAASKNGKTVVSVGLRNEIIIWNSDTKKHFAVDAANVLLRTASTSSCAASTITSVTVDDTGRHLAIGTGAGLIATWSVDKAHGSVRPLPLLALENSSVGVTEMRFVPPIPQYTTKKPRRTPSISEPNSPESLESSGAILFATYENGVAARWTIGDFPTVSYFSSSRHVSVVRSLLVNVIPENRVLVAFCLDDGGLDLVETGDYEPTMLAECCLQPGNPLDLVSKVHACRAEMNGSMRLIIAAATESGSVSLWDGITGECISVLDESYGHISYLRVSPVECETCHFCGQLPMESIAVAFSVDHVIRFSKLYLNDQTRRCSCSRAHHHQQQQLRPMSSRESLGRSRSNSTTSSQMGSPHISPLLPRARLATAFETSAFPVSGHGVHSRRASEKDTSRRSSELLTVPFPGNLSGDEYDGFGQGHDLSGSTTPTNNSASPSVWRNAVLFPLVDVTCERGAWDVMSKMFVGIRRKPRSQGKLKTPVESLAASASRSSGLTSATLERWELWTFDPAVALLRSSLLAGLSPHPQDADGTSSSSPTSSSSRTSSSSSINTSNGAGIARLPFTRVFPLLTASSDALAGFGNTIGVFHFKS